MRQRLAVLEARLSQLRPEEPRPPTSSSHSIGFENNHQWCYYNLIERQWIGVIVYSSRSELTNWSKPYVTLLLDGFSDSV